MKQSSIEWLYNNLKSHFEHDGDLLEAVQMSFEHAKAMHKEELLEFYTEIEYYEKCAIIYKFYELFLKNSWQLQSLFLYLVIEIN